jgi:hypothetical protein
MAKRKKRASRQRRSTGRQAPVRPVSEAAKRVTQRIATAGPEYLSDNFIRVMRGSADLRADKEFASFHLEPLPLLMAAARRFPRFRRRLKRATRQRPEKILSLYDDYRIAVLNDLDTPELRRQLQKRIGRCLDRLKYGHDEAKIENAMFLSVLLSDKTGEMLGKRRAIPLGAYGLVTVIYEDSFDRAMETIPRAREIVGAELYELWCLKHREEDLAAIESTVEGLGTFEELAARLESDRALARAWQRQERHLGEALELHIASNALHFDPSFFTPDEIALAMDRMERRHWSKPWSLSRYLIPLAMYNLALCVREAIDEVVSPERVAKLVETLKATGQSAIASGDEQMRSWVPALQAAIDDLLEAETPSQSIAMQALYLQSLLETIEEDNATSPRWQRFLKRLRQSLKT